MSVKTVRWPDRAKAILLQCATEGGEQIGALLSDLVFSVGTEFLGIPELPDELVSDVLDITQSSPAAECPQGWRLLGIFDQDWHKVTMPQRAAIAKAAKGLYCRSRAPEWCFHLSEFMGTRLAHEFGDQILSLARESRLSPVLAQRQFAPHLLEHLVSEWRSAGDLRSVEALQAFQSFSQDDSPEVRREVKLSLHRLGISDSVLPARKGRDECS